jgi:hypothetical protein
MNQKYLWTIKWTQPYATYQMRPYMRKLRDEFEVAIETKLARGEFDDAKKVIERIMML